MKPIVFCLIVAILFVSCNSQGASSAKNGSDSCAGGSSGHVGKPGETKPSGSCRP